LSADKLASPPTRPPAGLVSANSIAVVDGDTVSVYGQNYRLVGYDTPESGARAKCEAEREMAARATRRLREIVTRGDVKFERVACTCPAGTEGTPACNHGRLCAVLTAAGRDVGTMLIGEGLAHSYVCVSAQCPARWKWC
jgi:endonuclease YncB( thermonuclease family)